MDQNSSVAEEEKFKRLIEILTEAKKRDASDIHLAPASPVMLRIDGVLVPIENQYFKPYDIDIMLEEMLTEEQQNDLKENGELDFAYSVPEFIP